MVLGLISITGAAEAEKKYIELGIEQDVRFEAEDYATIINSWVFDNTMERHKGWSGDGYVMIDPSAGANLNPTGKEIAGLEYYFDVKKEQLYYFWVYVYARGTGSRTLYYKFDDGVYSMREFDYEPEGWRWQLLCISNLKEGKHTLGFTQRHMYVPFDRFIITNQPDFNPAGLPLSTPEFLPKYGEKRQQTYNLPAITPTVGQHPRLLMNSKMIPEIRKNLTHPQNIAVYEYLKERAAADLDGKFPDISPTGYTNVSMNVCEAMQANAFLYAVNGDKEAGEKAIMQAMNAVSTAQGRGSGTDAFTRYGGHLLVTASCVYDWCYDIMTDDDRLYMRKFMYNIASLMEIGYPQLAPGNVTGHNLEGQIWKDFLSMSVAIYDEDPKMYNTIAGRLFDEIIPIKNILYQSNCFNEGVGYGPFRYFYEMYTAYVFKALGYENVFTPEQRYALYGQLYRRRPDGKFIATGDYADEELYGFTVGFNNGYFMAGNYYKDPILKREYFRTTPGGISRSVEVAGVSCAMHLILNDVSVPVDETAFQQLPLTSYSGPVGGYMNARTSWDEGKKSSALQVQFNTHEYFFGSHQHPDAGHFDIFYKGVLALDSGIYESDPYIDGAGKTVTTNLSYGGDQHWGYYQTSAAHNVMLVDGDAPIITSIYNPGYNIDNSGQLSSSTLNSAGVDGNYDNMDAFKVGQVLSYDYGPDTRTPAFSYLKGDITAAYASNNVEDYTRTFLFMNFFDDVYPGALIVFDNITSEKAEHKKTWQFHTQEEPQIDGNKFTVKRTEFDMNGRLINDSLLPEKIKMSKIGGPGFEYENNGIRLYASPKTPNQEAGKWKIHISPEKASKQDYFLNVMQVSDNNDEIVPLKAELIENGSNYVGVRIKDRVAFLKKDNSKVYKEIKIDNSDAEGDFMYFVDSVKQGKWSVYDENGKFVCDGFASEGHDSFIFKAPAGKYTLRWSYMEKPVLKDFSFENNMFEKNGQSIDVRINAMYETLKNKPYDIDGVLYLPLAETMERAEVDYKIDGSSVTIKASKEVTVTAGNRTAKADSEEFDLGGVPELKNGVLYAPIGEIAKTVGYNYTYYPVPRTATLATGSSSIDKLKLVNSDDPARVRIESVKTSVALSSTGYDTVDGNLASYWAGEGKGQWIEYTFEKPSTLSHIDVKWHVGHSRKEYFEVYLSEDGENWKMVFDGESSGKDTSFERVNFNADGEYKYLKITGYGNSSNAWNSMSEIRIYNKEPVEGETE